MDNNEKKGGKMKNYKHKAFDVRQFFFSFCEGRKIGDATKMMLTEKFIKNNKCSLFPLLMCLSLFISDEFQLDDAIKM